MASSATVTAFVVHVPTVPLGRLYGDELRTWLTAHAVEVRENVGVKRLVLEEPKLPTPFDCLAGPVSEASRGPAAREGGDGKPHPPAGRLASSLRHVELRDGSDLTADWYVLAVPFDRVAYLLPEELVSREPYFGNVKNLIPSPITSVHLWFDRTVMTLPHVVLIDCLGQWVFDRGEAAQGEFYLQVVVSAARDLTGLGRDEIQRRIVEELTRLFPLVAQAKFIRAKLVTEHAATFSAAPGVDRWRPVQASPLANLAVAGDWTATGWPATMEGAVRSGYLAAEVILERAGQPAKLVQADL